VGVQKKYLFHWLRNVLSCTINATKFTTNIESSMVGFWTVPLGAVTHTSYVEIASEINLNYYVA